MYYLCKKWDMRFERILENGRLWAVMYDGDSVYILERVFSQWNDYEWLRTFFIKHMDDLSSYFHIKGSFTATLHGYDCMQSGWNRVDMLLRAEPSN